MINFTKTIIILLNLGISSATTTLLVLLQKKYLAIWIEFTKGFTILKEKIQPILKLLSKYINIIIVIFAIVSILNFILLILEFKTRKELIKAKK